MSSTQAPLYYKQPIRWLRYYSHTKPHLFYAVSLGLMGPAFLFAVTPLRRKYLFEDHVPVPTTYPIPNTPRNKELTGFDDE